MSEFIYYDLMGSKGLATGLPAQVARELGRRIVAGHYKAQEFIEDEGALSARYGVSRTVVREAVKTLCAKGLLKIRRGVGTQVESRSSWRLLDEDVLAWHQSAPPSADTLKQLLEIRYILEPNAAMWAASRANEEDLEEIGRSVDRMKQAIGTAQDFIIADAGFHRAVLHAAHNEFLAALEGVIYSALLTSISLTNNEPSQNESSTQLHRAVADAIEQGNGEQAAERMRTLLSDATDRLQKWMPPS